MLKVLRGVLRSGLGDTKLRAGSCPTEATLCKRECQTAEVTASKRTSYFKGVEGNTSGSALMLMLAAGG